MSGWIIAGAIVVVILILLMTSVTVRFEYSGELRLKINWLFINLVQIPAKTKKMKRRDKKAIYDIVSASTPYSGGTDGQNISRRYIRTALLLHKHS